MPATYFLSVALLLIGIVVRVRSSGRFLATYERKHATPPPKNWLARKDLDPEVEHWRRRTVQGTAIALIGILVLFFEVGFGLSA